jgi:bacillithiol synthase
MTLPRVITEPLGGSPLSSAAQRGELSQWYIPRPRNVGDWRAYLQRVSQPHDTGAWLADLAPALGPTGAAKERLDRAVETRGVVISTGQQAALFGGPLYTLVKALGALALADVLQRETGISTAPVFWAATDDADFEEASSASIAVVGGVRTLRLASPFHAGVAMNDLPMPNVEQLVDELGEACGSTIEPQALDLVRECYRSTATLGAAYVTHLRGLFAPLGIAVLDASHPGVRNAAEPVLLRALESAAQVERALRQRFDAIRAAGHTPQVDHVPELSLVFAGGAGQEKRRVPVREAARTAARRPAEVLSANVLLRPIVERFIMPSAAYVAGPAELAYFAQVGAVAAALDLPTPLAMPRWSVTILEPRIERLLNQLGASPDDLRDPHQIETRLARESVPEEVSDSLRRLRHDLESDVAALEVSDGDELIPPASLQGLRRSLLHRVERTERRYLAAVKRRETKLMRDVGTAAAALYPGGKRQERVLNFVPFLARYGQPLLDLMRREAEGHAAAQVGATVSATATPVAERV